MNWDATNQDQFELNWDDGKQRANKTNNILDEKLQGKSVCVWYFGG